MKHLAILLALVLPHALAAEAKRPNILFILTDDQSPFDFKIYNPKSPLETPNIDRLAAEGMVFDGAYHMGSFSGAVCTPSRHMIMSGRTVWHLPIGPGAKTCPPNLEKNTIGAVFNRAGYKTMRTCKKGNSYPAANKQFSVVHDATKRGGTDESGSAWHADRVMDYLNAREAAKETAPFFIYFGFSHPHDTRDGKPGLLAKYGATNHRDRTRRRPPIPSNRRCRPTTCPPTRSKTATPRSATRWPSAASGGTAIRRTIRNELGREFACDENIDIQIGRVLAKLEAMGELDNTYIFYTADHGIAIGRHGLQGKQNLYQHTWRVPFIVKGPGIKPGTRAQGNIYLLDLLATFCDLATIPPPETNEVSASNPCSWAGKTPSATRCMEFITAAANPACAVCKRAIGNSSNTTPWTAASTKPSSSISRKTRGSFLPNTATRPSPRSPASHPPPRKPTSRKTRNTPTSSPKCRSSCWSKCAAMTIHGGSGTSRRTGLCRPLKKGPRSRREKNRGSAVPDPAARHRRDAPPRRSCGNFPAARGGFSNKSPATAACTRVFSRKKRKIGLVRSGSTPMFAAPQCGLPAFPMRGRPSVQGKFIGSAPEKSFSEVSSSSLRFAPTQNQNHAGNHADHQSARSQGTPHSGREVEVTRSRELPTAPRSLPSSHDPHAQEAELGSP